MPVAVNCSVVPLAIERFGAVTAIETRVGSTEDGEREQLDSKARAQIDARTAPHLRLPRSEYAMFAILQRCGISNTVTAVSMLTKTAALRGGTIRAS